MEQTEQPPPVIMQRVAGTRGISLHDNGHIGFACVVKDGEAPTGGIVEPPSGRAAGTDIVYIDGGGEPGYVWGWAPKGAISVNVESDGTRATGELLSDGMFAFWIPDGPMLEPWISVYLSEGVLLSGGGGPAGAADDDVRSAGCLLPRGARSACALRIRRRGHGRPHRDGVGSALLRR
jgi:hypothetical protein